MLLGFKGGFLWSLPSSSLPCPRLGQVGKYWKFNCVVSNFGKLAPLSVGYVKTVSELGFCVGESFAQVRRRTPPQTSTSSLPGRHPPPPPPRNPGEKVCTHAVKTVSHQRTNVGNYGEERARVCGNLNALLAFD